MSASGRAREIVGVVAIVVGGGLIALGLAAMRKADGSGEQALAFGCASVGLLAFGFGFGVLAS